MENFWKNIGSTIPVACQDWAGTKAAYRFLLNPHVDESSILQGHFESTRQRVATLKNEAILLLQDTTTFIYQRDNPDIIGYTGTTSAWGKRKDKSKGKIVNCGILMHSSLAITSRGQLVKFRTAQINALHGTLLEFGEIIHKGRAAMDRELPAALERMKATLPPYLITVLEDQHNRLKELDSLINILEKQLNNVARQNETCKRLMEIPGVGPLIASAAVATMGEAAAFKSGREFAAYVGLVPKQTGSGGKVRLLGISKRGDTYLRTLFIHGARA